MYEKITCQITPGGKEPAVLQIIRYDIFITGCEEVRELLQEMLLQNSVIVSYMGKSKQKKNHPVFKKS